MKNKENIISMEEVKKRKELINLYQTGLDDMLSEIVEEKRVKKVIDENMDIDLFIKLRKEHGHSTMSGDITDEEYCEDCCEKYIKEMGILKEYLIKNQKNQKKK